MSGVRFELYAMKIMFSTQHKTIYADIKTNTKPYERFAETS